jgi:hypothetical protein
MSTTTTTICVDHESNWFRVITLIGAGFGAGFFITNAVYWDRIRNNPCNAISASEANTMRWISIIFAVIFFIIAFWALIRLIWHPNARAAKVAAVKQYISQPIGYGGSAVVTEVKSK